MNVKKEGLLRKYGMNKKIIFVGLLIGCIIFAWKGSWVTNSVCSYSVLCLNFTENVESLRIFSDYMSSSVPAKTSTDISQLDWSSKLADYKFDPQINVFDLAKVISLPNITIDYNTTVTSAQFSTYRILNEPEVGKYVIVQIYARDGLNKSRASGGDFWICVMDFPSSHYAASTSAHAQDHQNGTYTVNFFVGWAGAIRINITLVHPSTAISALDLVRNLRYPSRMFWNTTFHAKNSKETAHSTCTVDFRGPDFWKDKCSYPNLRALGENAAFVCEKPGGNFTCDSMTEYNTYGTLIGQTYQAIGLGCNCTWMFSGNHYMQQLKPQIMDMNSNLGTQYEIIDNITKQLPICNSFNQSGVGFWRANVWTSLVCRTRQLWYKASLDSFGKCLKNKDVYFLGDSTTRQWSYQLSAFLGAPVPMAKTKNLSLFYKYKHHFDKFNMSITFQFHPQILGSKPVSISDEMYEVDVIDGLQNSECNYIVLISPWAHFSQWLYSAYVKRLQLLKESINRLRKRCPHVPVIVKSPHVRDHKDVFTQLLSSDYIIFKSKQAIEEVFADAELFYINVWDMNNAFPGKKAVHMPATVVKQELSILMSYICPSVIPKPQVKAVKKAKPPVSKAKPPVNKPKPPVNKPKPPPQKAGGRLQILNHN